MGGDSEPEGAEGKQSERDTPRDSTRLRAGSLGLGSEWKRSTTRRKGVCTEEEGWQQELTRIEEDQNTRL